MTQNLNTAKIDTIADILKSPSTLLRLAAFLLAVAAFYFPVATYQWTWMHTTISEKLTLTQFYTQHTPWTLMSRIGYWPNIFASACGAALLIAPFSHQVGRILDLLAVVAGAILCTFIVQNMVEFSQVTIDAKLNNFQSEAAFFLPMIALALMAFQFMRETPFFRLKPRQGTSS